MFTTPIPDIQHSVIRPMAHGVAVDLIKKGILPIPKYMEFRNYIDVTQRKDKKEQANAEGFAEKDRTLIIKATETLLTTGGAGHRRPINSRPIIVDKYLGLHVSVDYEMVQVEYEFKHITASRNKLVEWRQTNADVIRRSGASIHHTQTYTIGLSNQTHQLLQAIYALRDKNYSYGDSYEDWLRICMPQSTLGLQRGPDSTLAIGESQVRTIGLLEGSEGVPEITEERAGLYAGTIKYKHTYRRPAVLHHRYPIQVHQNTMPNRYLSMGDYVSTNTNVYIDSPIMKAFTQRHTKSDPFWNIRVPDFDKTLMPEIPKGYSPIVTVLTCLSGTEEQILFNLTDIPEVHLTDDILTFIKDEGTRESITRLYRCPLLLSLYKETNLLHTQSLIVDADLNVKNTLPVNPRHQYRVVLSVLVSPGEGLYDIANTINKYPKARTAITALVNHIRDTDPARHFIGNSFMVPMDWERRCTLWGKGKVVDKEGMEVDKPRSHPDIESLRHLCERRVLSSATVMSLYIDADKKRR